MKKEIIVEENIKPVRLDIYLKQKLLNYSRKQIAEFIKNGEILINDKKVKPSFLLKGKEKIALKIKKEKKELIPLPLKPEPKILYEDKNYLIIDKPSGINTHPNLKNLNQPSIASWLVDKYPFLKKVGEDFFRPGIIHRLDKDTSGILVIVKNNQSFFHLKEQFQKRLVKKEYLALVWGNLPFDSGFINYPLARSKKSPFRRKIVFNQTQKAKEALTFYQVLKRFKEFSLIRVIPKTGRTHQIRVHFASIGFPIVGDREYGKRKGKNLNFNRLFLHAFRIEFISLNNQLIKIESPLPKELKDFLEKLS
ncbi:MAG: RluA family pseudouridine synthase [Minisyncoccia bacterium]